MPLWLEHVLIFLIVAGCAAVLFRQAVGSLRGRGGLGRCCSRGCAAGQVRPAGGAQKVQIVPADLLRRRK